MSAPRIEAVVCVPTFRRPDWLQRTLSSLTAQRPDFGFAIVVIDNDAANPVGAAVARAHLELTGQPGMVAVEAQQGNCHAINAAFALALRCYPDAEFVLMIDDDEEADSNWLGAMVGAARASGADVVGGPVPRRFEAPASEAIQRHPLFASIEAPTGPVPMIHGSGNCLIGRSVFERLDNPAFDLRFNFLGGGDMEFFTRCRELGLRFHWCAEAIAYEYVPAARVSARWLMARSLRTGTINYAIDRTHAPGPLQLLRLFAKNLVSLGLSLPRAAGLLMRTRHLLPASHPILMSVGRSLAIAGFSPAPYKAAAAKQLEPVQPASA